jgi:hypothetical protein
MDLYLSPITNTFPVLALSLPLPLSLPVSATLVTSPHSPPWPSSLSLTPSPPPRLSLPKPLQVLMAPSPRFHSPLASPLINMLPTSWQKYCTMSATRIHTTSLTSTVSNATTKRTATYCIMMCSTSHCTVQMNVECLSDVVSAKKSER